MESILKPDGTVSQDTGVSDDQLRTMYWHMNLARTLNTKILNMQKTGRMGTYASILGQEGCQAGLAVAIQDKNVWLCQSFRETCVTVARGTPMEDILAYWAGDERGIISGAKLKITPISIPISSQLNHAAGIGYSMFYKGEQGCAIGFCGDGGTSAGEFHEAMNFAGTFHLPVIFFVQNNQWAISVPRKHQTASPTLAQKADGYGFEGVQVDGNDCIATYHVVKKALEKAFNGGGPTLIEAITYRRDNHTTADDWKKYRSEEEVKEWEAKDPINRLHTYMNNKGIWNDEHEHAMLEDAKKKVEEAVERHNQMPKPQITDMFDSLFATLPPHIQEEKDQLIKFWGAQ